MLVVSSALWDANKKSHAFSRDYNEEWVEKLYNGFARNLSVPFRFRLFVDRLRTFSAPIEQERLTHKPITYGSFIEPFKMNEPMILVGLDTVIVRNIDHMAEYCLCPGNKVALPIDPNHTDRVCNGVALIPPGHRGIYEAWKGENDMEFLRRRSGIAHIDTLFPGEVVSYKKHYMKEGLQKARIVYFHGKPKMNMIHDKEILEHWR